MGIDQRIDMKMFMKTKTEIEEITETGVIMSVSYQRLAVESLTPAAHVVIDTDSREDQPGLQYLRPILGKNFRVTLNYNGIVTHVSGLEKIIMDITSEIDSTKAAVQPYKNTLSDAFGVENIKNNLEYISPYYPDYKVSAGDEWTYEKVSKTAQFEFQLINVSSIKDLTPNNVIIQTNSAISTAENTTLQIDGMDATISMKGNQVAEMNADPSTGIVKNGVIKQSIIGDLILDMQDQGIENLKVPMKITTDIEVEIITD